MFERVGVPVFGIVENMGAFVDPATGRRFDFFGTGGGARLAEELGVPLLGSIPLQPGLAELADAGRPIVEAEPESQAATALRMVADELQRKTAGPTMALPILRG